MSVKEAWKLCKFPAIVRHIICKKRLIAHPRSVQAELSTLQRLESSEVRHSKDWKDSFAKLICEDARFVELANSFFGVSLNRISSRNACGNLQKVTLLCVVKDDLARMRKLLDWYRGLGVCQFAVIDDHSSDGTREFLIEQPDVDVFSSDAAYTTTIRQAWLARLIDYYGFGRWYLIVDSDELLSYEGCESEDIDTLVSKLTASGAKSGRALLLDMYGRGRLFDSKDFDEQDPYKGVDFFDPGALRIIERMRYFGVAGGMRSRLFDQMPTLTKHPLFYAEAGFVPHHSHYSFPYEWNDDAIYIGVLRHFKFLSIDRKKYAERATLGNFYGGSAEYKGYERGVENKELRAYDGDLSVRYVDSSSLNLIELPEGFDNRDSIKRRV